MQYSVIFSSLLASLDILCIQSCNVYNWKENTYLNLFKNLPVKILFFNFWLAWILIPFCLSIILVADQKSRKSLWSIFSHWYFWGDTNSFCKKVLNQHGGSYQRVATFNNDIFETPDFTHKEKKSVLLYFFITWLISRLHV